MTVNKASIKKAYDELIEIESRDGDRLEGCREALKELKAIRDFSESVNDGLNELEDEIPPGGTLEAKLNALPRLTNVYKNR